MLKAFNPVRNCQNCPMFAPRLDLRPMRSSEGQRGICRLTEQVVRAHWIATTACPSPSSDHALDAHYDALYTQHLDRWMLTA